MSQMTSGEKRTALVAVVQRMSERKVETLFRFLFGEPPVSNPYREGHKLVYLDGWTRGDDPRPVMEQFDEHQPSG